MNWKNLSDELPPLNKSILLCRRGYDPVFSYSVSTISKPSIKDKRLHPDLLQWEDDSFLCDIFLDERKDYWWCEITDPEL